MALKILFNPLSGEFDYTGSVSGSSVNIPEYTSDPVSPSPGDAWVLHTLPYTGGRPVGLLLALTDAPVAEKWEHSYRTLTGGIKRVELT